MAGPHHTRPHRTHSLDPWGVSCVGCTDTSVCFHGFALQVTIASTLKSLPRGDGCTALNKSPAQDYRRGLLTVPSLRVLLLTAVLRCIHTYIHTLTKMSSGQTQMDRPLREPPGSGVVLPSSCLMTRHGGFSLFSPDERTHSKALLHTVCMSICPGTSPSQRGPPCIYRGKKKTVQSTDVLTV